MSADIIARGQRVLALEAEALRNVEHALGASFVTAV